MYDVSTGEIHQLNALKRNAEENPLSKSVSQTQDQTIISQLSYAVAKGNQTRLRLDLSGCAKP